MFGVVPTGFALKRFSDIRDALRAEWRAIAGNDARTDHLSFAGQTIDIVSAAAAEAWESVQGAYSSSFLLTATGAALDEQVAKARITRNPASSSTATVTITGTPGTIVPAGSVFEGAASTRWTTDLDATIGVGGTVDAAVTASVTGPLIALSGSITGIPTPIVGVTAVTNALDSSSGEDVESDAALRARFLRSFRNDVSSAVARVPGVTESLVTSNRTSATDADGRPAHSYEVIALGGDDQAIFDTILAAGPAGIEPYGFNVNGTALDSQGNSQPVGFTRPVDANIFMTVTYMAADGAAANIETLIALELVLHGSTLGTGSRVVPFQFVQNVETPNIESLSIAVGRSASPTSTNILTMAKRERPRFDSSRISFVRLN